MGHGYPSGTLLSGSSGAWESQGHQGSSQECRAGTLLPKETMKQQEPALASHPEKRPPAGQ